MTGWTLAFRDDDSGPRPEARELRDPAGRLEINPAYDCIRQAFRDQPHQPHQPRKMGLKTDARGPAIEVAFVSPQVAARYAGVLDEVSRRIGWAVRAAARTDQQEIFRIAREVVPATWTLRKTMGLDTAAGLVRVTVFVRPDDAEVARVNQPIHDRCGYQLSVQV